MRAGRARERQAPPASRRFRRRALARRIPLAPVAAVPVRVRPAPGVLGIPDGCRQPNHYRIFYERGRPEEQAKIVAATGRAILSLIDALAKRGAVVIAGG